MAIHQFQTPDFSLRQLQYAVAVAQTGGFGAAAALCSVSQPSLSAQVAKLEAALEVTLFLRSPRGVLLSPEGERLLPTFRAALNAGASVEAAAATLRTPYAVPVRIAVIPTVAPYLLPAVTIATRGAEGPVLHWLELQTNEAEQALAEGRTDAILIADPLRDASLHVEELGWEPFFVAIEAEASVPDALPVEWLHDRQILLLEDGHCLRDQTLSLCRLPNTLRSPVRATSLNTLIQMVAAGQGVSVIPSMAIAPERARTPFQTKPFVDASVGRSLSLVSLADHPLTPVLGEIAETLRSAMKTLSSASAPVTP
ncbi:MAG: LysR family transcriptional regulator [Nannocystaceae bacterium]|nr:LysR family transcriptional regulator [bacterium]